MTRLFFGCVIAGMILTSSFRPAHAQQVVIKQVELSGGKVVLHYDLNDDNTEHRYTLRLYSSKDNFVQPLAKVTGDVGPGIPVGGNKQMTWDARSELGSGYDGSVSLRISGQLYIPFITLSHFEDFGAFKRGKAYPVTWSGGRGDNIMNWDLYRGEKKVWTKADVANTGKFNLVIPMDVKSGRNYTFRISDTKDPDEVIFTNEFSIKSKIPMAFKIGAGIIVAGGVYVITQLFKPIPDPPAPTR